jgi:hypothetical protein
MAEQLVLEASKKLNTFFFKDTNRDLAIEMLNKTANLYKINKEYQKSI